MSRRKPDYYDIETGPDVLTVSDPGPGIYLKGPQFGMLAFNLTSSASGIQGVLGGLAARYGSQWYLSDYTKELYFYTFGYE